MASLNKDSSQKYILDEKSTHLLWMWNQRHHGESDSDVHDDPANDYN